MLEFIYFLLKKKNKFSVRKEFTYYCSGGVCEKISFLPPPRSEVNRKLRWFTLWLHRWLIFPLQGVHWGQPGGALVAGESSIAGLSRLWTPQSPPLTRARWGGCPCSPASRGAGTLYWPELICTSSTLRSVDSRPVAILLRYEGMRKKRFLITD